MINGITQLNSVLGGKEAPLIKSPKSEGKKSQSFGSVFASLAGADSAVNPRANAEKQADVHVSQLLEAETADEIAEFLAAHIKTTTELPDIHKNQLVFLDKVFPELLLDIMPNSDQLDFAEDAAEMIEINVWELLEQVSLQFPNLAVEIEQAFANRGSFSKDEAMKLLALMKMAAIELPKHDLTLRQEQQLEVLRTAILDLNTLFVGLIKEKPQTRFFSLPFMEHKHPVQLTGQAAGQSSHLKDSSNEAIAQPGIPFSFVSRTESMHTELAAQEKSRAEQLFRELQNVFKRANFGQVAGTKRISVKLYPEHLGQLRIELLQTNGVLTARILASSALGKEMLESHLHQLRNAFLQQNIQVERIDISQMLHEAPDSERGQAFNGQYKGNEEHAKEHSQEENAEEQKTFEEYMIELEV